VDNEEKNVAHNCASNRAIPALTVPLAVAGKNRTDSSVNSPFDAYIRAGQTVLKIGLSVLGFSQCRHRNFELLAARTANQ
jgi:hypothetical protein